MYSKILFKHRTLRFDVIISKKAVETKSYAWTVFMGKDMPVGTDIYTMRGSQPPHRM